MLRGRLIAIALFGTAGALGSFAASAEGASEESIVKLRAQHCPPEYKATITDPPPVEEQERALDGYFRIRGDWVQLVPPVDWRMNPRDSKAWVREIQNLGWLRALFAVYQDEEAYSEATRHAALLQARDLALDWIEANPLQGDIAAWRAWGDKRAADRVPYLAYLTRAGACEDILSDKLASTLLDSLKDHGEYLSNPDVYQPTNHGLFTDLGLTLLAGYVPFWAVADEWSELARHRFEDTLRRQVNWDEGVWLEHSAGYQFLVLGLIEKFARYTDNRDSELFSLLDRMWDVGGWLTMPDDRIVQFGDTLKTPPERALVAAKDDSGLRTYRGSGYAIVKPSPGRYLAMTAGYHNGAHKHADDLSFDLYEGGHRILSDTGLYHKDRDRFHEFDQSSRAHSVLTADGADFPHDGEGPFYGSGIMASGSQAGWYAILGKNPSLRRQDVQHRRLLLYRPGEALLIADRVRASDPHKYQRYFQLGPNVDIQGKDGDLALDASGLHGVLHDDQLAAKSRLTTTRAQDEPLLGWTFPVFRQSVPRWTVKYTSEKRNVDHTAAVSLSGQALQAETNWTDESTAQVLIRRPGGMDSSVEVSRTGGQLQINEKPLP